MRPQMRPHEFTSVSEGLRAKSDYNEPWRAGARDHERVGWSRKVH